jgi:drug/metabolite transporter (DMT)-like permease
VHLQAGAGPRALGALLFLGLVSSGVAFTLWYVSQARVGPQRSAAVQYLQPFITLFSSAAVLHEPVTARVLVAGPLVLFGVYWVGRGARPPGAEVGAAGVSGDSARLPAPGLPPE